MNLRHSHLGLGTSLLLAALLGACSSAESASNEPSSNDPKADPTQPGTEPSAPATQQGFELLVSDVQRQVPHPTAASESSLAAGNRAFALDVYAQLKGAEGNLFFSPYSMSTALAMAYVGARGETKTEMQAALHFDLPDEELHAAFNGLARTLDGRQLPESKESSGLKLEAHNDIWAHTDPGLRPLQSYVDSLALNYATQVKLVDFEQAESARNTINGEVKRLTHDTVVELLPSGVIVPGLTTMVLTNTIYFKAGWQLPFEPYMTQQAPFTDGAGDEHPVDMMHAQMNVQYAANDDLQAVRLPYVGEQLGLWVLLPKTERFAAVEDALDDTLLGALASSTESTYLDLKLPKVKMRSNLSLKGSLTALGMAVAFDAGRADFSGIGAHQAYIQDVVHEAFINLDESGTEAGAATAVIFGDESAPAEPEIEFNANHPFILLLEDSGTKSVLFAGRVSSPE